MFTYTIKKDEPLVLLPPPSVYKGYNKKVNWTKLEYTRWIESVKLHFAIGDLVTLTNVAVNDKFMPYYYEIIGINELHYTCDWDEHLQEPQAIMCNTPSNFMLHKCPSCLRKLTFEEEAHVRLSNPLQKSPVC